MLTDPSPALRAKWLDGFLILAIVGVLVLVYWPTLANEYGFHNDYRARDLLDNSFDTSSLKGMLKHLESMHLMYVGRPINALAFNLQQSFFHSIADFAIGRAVTLALTIMLAVALYLFLRVSLRVAPIDAAVLSLATYCVPSFQLYIDWVANFVPGTLNVAISVLAFHCALIGWSRSSKWLSRDNAIWLAAAFLLLQVGLFNYPATALFLLAYLFLFIAYSPAPSAEIESIAKRILGLTVVAIGAYFIVFKFVYFPSMQGILGEDFRSYDPDTYKFALIPNENMLIFIGDLVRYGFLAWLPTTSAVTLPILNGTAVVVASLVWLCWPTESGSADALRLRAAEGEARVRMMVLAAAVSVLPFLLSPKSFVAYRVEAPWFAMAAVAIAGSYLRIARLGGLFLHARVATVATLAIVATIAATTLFNVKNTVQNAVVELSYFRERLADLPAIARSKKAEILVVLPSRFSSFVEDAPKLDLAYTATNYSGLMYGIVHMIAEESGVARGRYEWRQESSPDADMIANADLIVDLRKIATPPPHALGRSGPAN